MSVPPFYFAPFDVFKDFVKIRRSERERTKVYFLTIWIINYFNEIDDIWMLTLLHDGDFSPDLVFLFVRVVVSQSLLRHAIDYFNGYGLPRIEILGLFHLSMNTSANVAQNLVIINRSITCSKTAMTRDSMRFKDVVDSRRLGSW